MIKLIFATGPSGEFGNGDGLPWDLPEDLAQFKEYTKDSVLVMSGATFESLPGLLPGRPHCVISDRQVVTKRGNKPDYLFDRSNSLQDVLRVLSEEEEGKDQVIIGGRYMLEEAVTMCDEASIAFVKQEEVGNYTSTIDIEFIVDILSSRLVDTQPVVRYQGFDVLGWK